MIPAGYMSKKVLVRPSWLDVETVDDIYSVSGCISDPFAYYINYWKHNGYWFFNSPSDIKRLAKEENLDLTATTLFYYEVYEKEFDEESREWSVFAPEPSIPTHVQKPTDAQLVGYDVTSFSAGTSPECSPLSCNSVAKELAVNRHCLFDTFDQAFQALEGGRFNDSEPGPFRIFAVYRITT